MFRHLKKNSIYKNGLIVFSISMGMLFIFYFLAIIPFCRNIILKSDILIFEFLNDSLEKNPVWDWTILTTSSNLFIITGLVITALFILIEGWNKRKINYGRIYTIPLLSIIIGLIILFASAELNDYISTPAPWLLPGYDDILDNYNVNFKHLHKESWFPDDTIITVSFIIFFCGSISIATSLILLFFLLFHIIANITLGTVWPTTEAASFLIGSLTGGLLLYLFHPLIRKLDPNIEFIFLFCFSKHVINAKDKNLIESKNPELANKLMKIKNLNSLTKESFWNYLMNNVVFPILSESDKSLLIYSVPPNENKEKIRASKYVKFLCYDKNPVYVIKAARTLGGFFVKPGRVAKYINEAKINLKLYTLGIPVPRIHYAHEGFMNAGFTKYFVSIEQYVNASPIDINNEEDIDKAIEIIINLHSFYSESWGSAIEKNNHSIKDYIVIMLRRQFLYYLKKTEIFWGVSFDESEIGTIWHQLCSHTSKVFDSDKIKFRLIHGDITPRNILADKNKKVTLIDLQTVKYDLFGTEVIKSAISLANKSSEASSKLWIKYFAKSAPDRWNEFKAQSNLVFALYGLREFAHGRTFIESKHSEAIDKEIIIRWIKNLLNPPEDLWGKSPRETNWERIFYILYIDKSIPMQ